MFIPVSVAFLLCLAVWQPVVVGAFCVILISILFCLVVQMTKAIHKTRVVLRRSEVKDASLASRPVSSSPSQHSATKTLLQAQEDLWQSTRRAAPVRP